MRSLCIVIAVAASQLTLVAAPPMPKPAVGDVYVADTSQVDGQLCNVEDVTCRQSPTQLARLTLPAGSYTIAAKLFVSNGYDVNTVESYLNLLGATTIIDFTAVTTTQNVNYVSVSLEATATFSSDQTVTLVGQRNPFNTNGPTTAGAIQLIATRVGSIRVQ